jgi:[citrate (pro-3S)-lyase] ligase
VKKGTADMGNVIVIPSGKYIISLSTFPGYFNKEKDNEKTIDASGDLNIFCRYIAPCLNIKKRFVGEEPIDNITNQYNRQMESILKEYGIEFVEISRCKSLGEIISASKVRSYLQSKRFDKIEKMVPVTTFEYLKKKYGE